MMKICHTLRYLPLNKSKLHTNELGIDQSIRKINTLIIKANTQNMLTKCNQIGHENMFERTCQILPISG